MKLCRACLIAFAASTGAIVGLGVVGMVLTPPEQRPSHIRRQRTFDPWVGPASRRPL